MDASSPVSTASISRLVYLLIRQSWKADQAGPTVPSWPRSCASVASGGRLATHLTAQTTTCPPQTSIANRSHGRELRPAHGGGTLRPSVERQVAGVKFGTLRVKDLAPPPQKLHPKQGPHKNQILGCAAPEQGPDPDQTQQGVSRGGWLHLERGALRPSVTCSWLFMQPL